MEDNTKDILLTGICTVKEFLKKTKGITREYLTRTKKFQAKWKPNSEIMMGLSLKDKWVEKESSLGITETFMTESLNITRCTVTVQWP